MISSIKCDMLKQKDIKDMSVAYCSEDEFSPTTDSSEDSVEVKVSPINTLNHCRKKRLLAETWFKECKRRKTGDPEKDRRKTESSQMIDVVNIKTEPDTDAEDSFQSEAIKQKEQWLNSKDTVVKSEFENPFRPWDVPLFVSPQFYGSHFVRPSPTKNCDMSPSSYPLHIDSSAISGPQSHLSPSGSCHSESSKQSDLLGDSRQKQRNYKNMTRERRVEANARERTRVHTISAAFESLRHSVPSYSHSQKLSKLSILRVACQYILMLSRLAGKDYSEDQSAPNLIHCVEGLTQTIQTEGKTRKRKDD